MTSAEPVAGHRAAGLAPVGPAADRILLATDLTESSAAATEEALLLAARLGAALVIVSVVDPGAPGLAPGRPRPRVDHLRDQREHGTLELVARARGRGLQASYLVWTGDPGDMIVAAAEAERADIVVIGSNGRGAVGRFLLGSVSERVVREAPCPVLVVRPRRHA